MNKSANQHGEFETDQEIGRPTSWKPEYNDMIIEFFDVAPTKILQTITTGKNDFEKVEEKEIANTMPTFERFSHKIGINIDTLYEWKKPQNKVKYPGFSEAYKTAQQLQEAFWIENGMKGLHNPAFAIFWAKNRLTYKDRLEEDEKSKDLTVNINFDV